MTFPSLNTELIRHAGTIQESEGIVSVCSVRTDSPNCFINDPFYMLCALSLLNKMSVLKYYSLTKVIIPKTGEDAVIGF